LRHRRERHARERYADHEPEHDRDHDPRVMDDLRLRPGREDRDHHAATPARTPFRAVFGSLIQWSEKMKRAVATRYAS
jgi:hypothetical protein